jgi:hypothetical protein
LIHACFILVIVHTRIHKNKLHNWATIIKAMFYKIKRVSFRDEVVYRVIGLESTYMLFELLTWCIFSLFKIACILP